MFATHRHGLHVCTLVLQGVFFFLEVYEGDHYTDITSCLCVSLLIFVIVTSAKCASLTSNGYCIQMFTVTGSAIAPYRGGGHGGGGSAAGVIGWVLISM